MSAATQKSNHYVNQNSGDGSWSDFVGDVYSGVAVGIGHPKWFVLKTVDTLWTALTGVSRDDSVHADENGTGNQNSYPVPDIAGSERSLKVVGVGYGRTGTYSLALALDELGYPTLHTQHLYENAEVFDMMVKNVFHRSIREDKVVMGNPDFDLLLEAGFTATMDLPFALYFDQIREKYPDCKFILTVRENSEVWFRSWDVLAKSITQPARYTSFIFTHVKKLEYYMRWLFSVVNSDKKYLSHPFPFPDQIKSSAIASYEKHNQLVRDSIPPSQLLEYNVRQGWQPLCEFLEIPQSECPSTHGIPFPKSNSARAVQIQSFSAFMGPLILAVFVLFSMFSLIFRKITGMSVVEWSYLQKRRFLQWLSVSLEKRSKSKRRSNGVKRE